MALNPSPVLTLNLVEVQQRLKEAQERFELQKAELKAELTASRAESSTLMGTVTEMQAERAMVWKERDKAIEQNAAKQALKEAEQALQREKDNGSGKMWVAELGEARDRITELVAGAKTYLRERDEARQNEMT